MDLIQNLNWRYATKRMNGQTVPQEKIDVILESIRLTASSAGLQPYKVFVVTDKETKEKLKAVGYNQPQFTEGSHILVFAAWEKVTQQKVDDYILAIATERNIPIDSLNDFKSNLLGMVSQSAEDNFNWAARQTYIGLGTALIAAATEKVDATPMEGFDNAGVDEVLDLQAQGLKSVSVLALGYRDEANDFLAHAKKVRKTTSDMFELV